MQVRFKDKKGKEYIIQFGDSAKVSYSKEHQTVYVEELGREYRYDSRNVIDVLLED